MSDRTDLSAHDKAARFIVASEGRGINQARKWVKELTPDEVAATARLHDELEGLTTTAQQKSLLAAREPDSNTKTLAEHQAAVEYVRALAVVGLLGREVCNRVADRLGKRAVEPAPAEAATAEAAAEAPD